MRTLPTARTHFDVKKGAKGRIKPATEVRSVVPAIVIRRVGVTKNVYSLDNVCEHAQVTNTVAYCANYCAIGTACHYSKFIFKIKHVSKYSAFILFFIVVSYGSGCRHGCILKPLS